MPLLDDPWLPAPDLYGDIAPVRAATPVAVYLFNGVSTLTLLPNLECLGARSREGTDPGSAQFRYNLASGLAGAPISIETALGTGSTGTYVIEAGDWLVVQGTRPDGGVECLFSGEAVTFSMGLGPETEEVYVGATGIAWRCWDNVIQGAILRTAALAATPTTADVPTSLFAQFNPQGLPNCTPDGAMSGTNGGSGMDRRYPVFLDPLVIQQPTDQRTYWTLPKALRYLLYSDSGNPTEQYVKNPDGAALDALLVSPSDTGDTTGPINCPDTPITAKDWPVTVNHLVSECGFGTSFDLTTNGSGLPVTTFNLFGQQAGPLKSLYLAPRGSAFSPTTFNFNQSSLSRDLAGVVNQWTVVGDLDRYEITVILQPLFPMIAADASNLYAFDRASSSYLQTAGNRFAYRLFGFDECGEGYYAPGTNTPVIAAESPKRLDGVLGPPDPVSGKVAYVGRRRVPLGHLVSVDKVTNKPLEARLSISTGYTGGGTVVIAPIAPATSTTATTGATYGTNVKPGQWDGGGGVAWQAVATSAWRLTDDRLGIEITCQNPNAWDVGQPTDTGMPYPGGVVNVIEAMATTGAQNFTLRLTCVIEGDARLSQVAVPGGGSPLSQKISRVIDASDRYRDDYLTYPSELNSAPMPPSITPQVLNPRDDSAAALAEAQAIRYGTEAGVLSGPVVIPRITTYYRIGDRLQQIEGRDLGLRTDNGTGTAIYPVVVGVSFNFEDPSTTLEVSDAGTDRTKYDRRPARSQGRRLADDAFWTMGSKSPGLMMSGGGGGVARELMGGGNGGLGPAPLMGGGNGGMANNGG